jgi:hypothetical protein
MRMILAGSPSITELSVFKRPYDLESAYALALPASALPYLEPLSCASLELVQLLPGGDAKKVEVILYHQSECSEQLTAALGSPALEELTVPVFASAANHA